MPSLPHPTTRGCYGTAVALAVLTRDPDAVVPYAAALAPLGLRAIAMPVTRPEPPADTDRARLAAAVAAIDRYDAVLVASARGAEALIAALRRRGRAAYAGPPVWAVGIATATTLTTGGITARTPPQADAAGLAAAVLAAGGIRRVLLPRAEGGRDEAIAALESGGVEVDAITAYRMAPVETSDPGIAEGLAAIAGDGPAPALIAVFAPSQVTALDAILGRRKLALRTLGIPVVAIGATTAAAVEAAGVRVVATATAPTPDGMAAAAAAVYQQVP